jgi:LAS superfamily LD-carboxypeptidase LdcB
MGFRRLTRRRLVRQVSLVALGLLPALAQSAATSANVPPVLADDWARRSATRSPLAEQLFRHPLAFQYGPDGSLDGVFGLRAAEARWVLYPVSRTRGLPSGYQPPDLVTELGQPLRALVVPEIKAMFQAAERDNAYPTIVSGYRSAEYQANVFEQAVQRQLWQQPERGRDEAERQAARSVAPPGRSQHQLGTTADLSSYELGSALRPAFAETQAGRWLAERAWEFGFVQPYTAAAEPRTGYVPEPWHYRWIGRPLASLLWQERYLASANPTADDWLVALEELLV